MTVTQEIVIGGEPFEASFTWAMVDKHGSGSIEDALEAARLLCGLFALAQLCEVLSDGRVTVETALKVGEPLRETLPVIAAAWDLAIHGPPWRRRWYHLFRKAPPRRPLRELRAAMGRALADDQMRIDAAWRQLA